MCVFLLVMTYFCTFFGTINRYQVLFILLLCYSTFKRSLLETGRCRSELPSLAYKFGRLRILEGHHVINSHHLCISPRSPGDGLLFIVDLESSSTVVERCGSGGRFRNQKLVLLFWLFLAVKRSNGPQHTQNKSTVAAHPNLGLMQKNILYADSVSRGQTAEHRWARDED